MDARFTGSNTVKVDGKGRVALPAKFRRALQAADSAMEPGGQPRLYIAYGNPRHEYVECLSGDAYDDLDARIQDMDEGEDERELLEMLYYALCDEVQVDDTGRFVLPGPARDKLALNGEAVFQGKGRKFHILRPEDSQVSKDRLEQMLDKFAGDKAFFNPVSLANKKKQIPVTAHDDE